MHALALGSILCSNNSKMKNGEAKPREGLADIKRVLFCISLNAECCIAATSKKGVCVGMSLSIC